MNDASRTGAARETWSSTTRIFHWLTAALVLAAWPIGVTMIRLGPGPVQDSLYRLHWSLGATILTVALLRWVHRLVRHPVVPPPGVPAGLYRVATTVHWSLYVLLAVVPLLGWAGKSAFGGPIPIFGLFDLPPLLARDPDASRIILATHKALALLLGGLVAVHVSGAFYHHLIRRDTTLLRMLPGGGRRR